MSAQDDPEERIRQLEQQSAYQGARELGATDPGASTSPLPPPTSPLPPPVYPDPYQSNPYQGDPYQPPFGTQFPQMQKKGLPFGLIFGLIGVVIVLIVGGVTAVVWNVMSKTNSIVISQPGDGGQFSGSGGGPTINIPTVFPSMPMMPSDEAPTGAPGEQLSIAGVQKNETIECNDAIVNVSGVNNTVELTGHCISVTVSGVNNRVTIDSTDTIGASGFDNQVTYRSGDPQIDASGSNTVQRG
jgi:hypothetical protein